MRYCVVIAFLFCLSIKITHADTLEYIKIFNPDGVHLEYKVEVVSSLEDQAKGLMFRESLELKEGMLFIFKNSKKASFWMKNTVIPLDIIFIKSDGSIDSIHQNLKPMSLRRVKSKLPVIAALEISGGDVAKYKINENFYFGTNLIN